MKYEADIIKEIVDKRGHEKTSIHYQSECVEEWVKEVEGAYPKLCDYQPEWLNYSNENNIGVFPYLTLTDVTDATVENVVPYAYKRAILSGNTLVNLATPIEYKNITYHGHCLVFNGSMLKSGEYTLKSSVDFSKYVINLLATQKDRPAQYKRITISKNGVFTIDDTFFDVNTIQVEDFFICLRPIDNTDGGTVDTNEIENCEVILLEGDYANVDIPYFEGMQSVKMPVLTTTNEDGTKTNILTVNEDVELRGIGGVHDTLDLMTGKLTENFIWLNFNGVSKNFKVESGIGTNVNTGYTRIWVRHINEKLDKNTLNTLLPSFNFEYNENSAPCECISYRNNGSGLNIIIKTERLGVVNNGGAVQWLEENMPPILCQLKESVVKTVDLSIVDQDGKTLERIKPIEGTMHLTTSGETIKPLFSGEVPVEAITQNLASFIEE